MAFSSTILNSQIIGTKLCQKEPQLKSASALLTGLISSHLAIAKKKSFAIEIIGILGRAIYRWKGLKHTFTMVYYTTQRFQNVSHKTKKKKIVIV